MSCRSQSFISDANRLTVFVMEESFAGKCYRTDHSFFSVKLEVGLTYVASFYSEHICSRYYHLHSITLQGLAGILQFVNYGNSTLNKVFN